MPLLSYLRAINRALGDEMERDPAVFIMGEDIREALTNTTPGLLARFGPDRVVETPLSEQGFTNFATGAALAGMRPVVEYQIPFLLLLVLEQIANQANKISVMSGGQASVPVTYLLPAAGWRPAWGGQHSDQPYSVFGHFGVKTVLPATPADAYGLMVSAIRDDDPVVLFAPIGAHDIRTDVVLADLAPVPLGVGRVHRPGTDVTLLATGHLVHDALAVADALSGEVSIEVFDPRTLYPFDWDGLFTSLAKTGRLVVLDDTNRFCGFAAEIVATVVEQRQLLAAPARITRPDSAVVGCAPELDVALQPSRDEVISAIRLAMKGSLWPRPAALRPGSPPAREPSGPGALRPGSPPAVTPWLSHPCCPDPVVATTTGLAARRTRPAVGETTGMPLAEKSATGPVTTGRSE